MGVKINNSIKPLNTKLKNGDQVEIITGKSPSFSSDWLDLSITGKAKACIKRYILIKEEEDFIKLGKEILINHFKNEKIRYSETNINNVLNNFKLKKIDELYKSIGNGTILPSKIISSLFPEKKLLENNEKVILLKKVKERKED